METKQLKVPLKKEESLFSQLLAKYITYWPLFLIFMVLSGIGAKIFLRYATPKYEATAKLIIKDEKKGTDDSKMLEQLNQVSTKKIIENEIEVLQSRELAFNVVKKLHLYAPIYQEGKIKSVPAYLSSPLTIIASNPDSIREFKKISLHYDKAKGIVLMNSRYGGVINEWLHTPYGTLKFVPNSRYVPTDQDKPFYFNLFETKEVTQDILDNLKVSATNKLSSVIDLSYRDELPERAEDILNELINAYNNASVNEKNNLAKNTLAFIEERLAVVGNDLDSIEKKIQQYKAGTGAVDISKQGELYLQNVSSNDQKLSDVNVQLSAINQLEKYVQSKDNNVGIMPSTLGVTDPSLTTLMTSLNNAEIEYDKLRKTVAENNPMLLSIKEQINKIKPNILENIQSQRRNLESSKQSLYSNTGSYNSMLSTIPVKERQLLEISRDQSIKMGIYSFLLQKREESELSYASNYSDSRVVNNAQSTKVPVSPNKLIIYLAALIGAFLIPIAFIKARESLTTNVLYRQDIEALTKVPIIGEMMYNKDSKKTLIVEAGKRTFAAEAFRKIRVALLYLGIDSTHKKLLVTSSISGEGKSFIAANLATSISLTGKKTVLVDLDLHNPSLSRVFDKEEDPGVSDYIAGKKEKEEIITKVQGNDNLFYISSGNLIDNPSELLENGRIQELIAYLDSKFDMVVIDTAPVVLVTDAFMLSNCCDATLYVVRHKVTPKIILKRMDENNKINPINNPAIIFNGVKTRGFFKNNHGYGYDSYVYGYGNNKKKK